MSLHFTLYAAMLLIAGLVSVGVGLLVRRCSPAPGQRALAWFMFAVAVWALANGLEMAAVGIPSKVFWTLVSYVGIVSAPVLFFIFSLQYTHRDKWLSRGNAALLWLVPAITFSLAATNHRHGLIWSSFTPGPNPEDNILIYGHGAWFWVHVVYSYSLLMTAAIALALAAWRFHNIYRRQALTLLIGLPIPWLGNIIYVAGLSPIPGLDLTPFAFIVSGAIIAWGVYVWRLFDLAPMARDAVVEHMSDAVLVLDAQSRLADANPAARRLLGLDATAIGEDLTTTLAAWPELMKACHHAFQAQTVIRTERAEAQYLELRIAPVFDHSKHPTGRLVILRDITEAIRGAEAEREQRSLAEALRDSAGVLNSTLNLDEVLDHILAELERVVPNDAAAVYLIEGRHAQAARCRSRRGAIEDVLGRISWDISQTTNMRRMVASGEPVVVLDTHAAADWIRFPETEWIRSYAGAPIQARGQVIGFLEVDAATSGFFGPREADRLRAFADQAAIAIENARLYTESHRGREALQAVNQELARRLDELDTANSELQARNAELDAYAHTVAHDLKNPLAQLLGYAELLQWERGDLTDKDVDEALTTIWRQGYKMQSIIEELLVLASMRKSDIQMQPLDMEAVVVEAQRRLEPLIKEYGVEFQMPAVWPVALGHAPWVEEIWVNYLSNGIKYGGRPPRLELGAGAQGPGGQVRFWVRDNGQGLTNEEQGRLFTPFTQLNQMRAKGHGLGLSIVRRIADRLGGTAGVESAAGHGSTFYFTLPAPAN
jgi:PAS domain S-box-containing protein